MDTAACPNAENWERLLSARLGQDEAEALDLHARACPACGPLVERLRRSGLPAARDEPTLGEEEITWLRHVRDTTPRAAPAWPETGAPPTEPICFGRYRVVALLGSGGMGEVYAAEDPQLNRRVAVKVVRQDADAPEALRARLQREAQALAALDHEHVVPVLDVGEERGCLYVVMPLLNGASLAALLQERKRLPLDEVVRMGRGIARALQAAHEQGIAHRDLKPPNVWVEQRDGRPHVRLLDFGLASAPPRGGALTLSGAVMGTVGYIAPEAFEGRPLDWRGDLFALGVVLYEMAAGRRPYAGGNLREYLDALGAGKRVAPLAEVDRTVPDGFSNLVASLLERDPQRRPASAREVVEVLTGQQAAPAVVPRRRSLVWVAVAAAVLLLIGGGIAVRQLSGRPAPEVDPAERGEAGPAAVLRLIAGDLERQPAAKRPARRYLRLDHLRDRPDDLSAARRAADALGARLGKGASPFVALDGAGTLLAFDLAALGWDEETWARVRREDPYGLNLKGHSDERVAARAIQVKELAKCEIPYARGDWLLAALTRPPLGGPDGAVWPTRSPPAELREVARASGGATLDLEQAAADLGAEPEALAKAITDAPYLREKLGLGRLTRGGEVSRGEWEDRPFAESRFQAAARLLGLGTPSDGE